MEKNLAKALVRAQSDLQNPTATRTGQVGTRRYLYADIGGYLEAVKEVFAKHGLAVVQKVLASDGTKVGVRTTIVHESGEEDSDEGLWILPDKPGPQGIGAALTYARRYGLAAMAGLATEDPDGVSESAPGGPVRRQEALRKPMDTSPDPVLESAKESLRAMYARLKSLGGDPSKIVGPEARGWGLSEVQAAQRALTREISARDLDVKPEEGSLVANLQKELDDQITEAAGELVAAGGDIDAIIGDTDIDTLTVRELQGVLTRIRAAVIRAKKPKKAARKA